MLLKLTLCLAAISFKKKAENPEKNKLLISDIINRKLICFFKDLEKPTTQITSTDGNLLNQKSRWKMTNVNRKLRNIDYYLLLLLSLLLLITVQLYLVTVKQKKHK